MGQKNKLMLSLSTQAITCGQTQEAKERSKINLTSLHLGFSETSGS